MPPSDPGPTGRRFNLSRRGLIKSGMLATAGILGGLTGGAYLARARPQRLVEPEEDLPAGLAGGRRRRVVVVGGGLAGLSAAIELQGRGFEVDLFEAGSECGGRAGGYRTDLAGAALSLDHGFHGFFFHYYNLRDLLARSVNLADFLPVDRYPLAAKGYPIDVFSASRLPLPFNMFAVMAQSQNLSLGSAVGGGVGQLVEMLRYDPVATFERLDGVDFASWARQVEVPAPFYDGLYEPYVRSMLVRPNEVSAAEIVQLFHGYFFANPEGLGMDLLRRPFLEGLVEPLVRHLRDLGARVHTLAPVQALHLEDGDVRGVIRRVAGPPRRVARFALADVPAIGHAEVATDLGSAFVRRTADGIEAIEASCTHMGCPVAIDADGSGFRCPCHGGRFDASGNPVAGPPKAPLRRLGAQVSGDEVVLSSTSASVEEVVGADYVILAADVAGVHGICANTQWPAAARDFGDQLARLDLCRPYSVARQWLDRPLDPDRYPLYAAGGYEVLDELFCLSQYHEVEREWARTSGGSVVETHCYALDDALATDPERVHDVALAEAGTILPELAGARVVRRDVQLLDNMTNYPVGAQARRPGTETPFASLLLAGDWVRIDLPLELMERANVSGRLAANRVLAREGVRRVAITTPPVRGILA